MFSLYFNSPNPPYWMRFYSIHVIAEYILSGSKLIWNQIFVKAAQLIQGKKNESSFCCYCTMIPPLSTAKFIGFWHTSIWSLWDQLSLPMILSFVIKKTLGYTRKSFPQFLHNKAAFHNLHTIYRWCWWEILLIDCGRQVYYLKMAENIQLCRSKGEAKN